MKIYTNQGTAIYFTQNTTKNCSSCVNLKPANKILWFNIKAKCNTYGFKIEDINYGYCNCYKTTKPASNEKLPKPIERVINVFNSNANKQEKYTSYNNDLILNNADYTWNNATIESTHKHTDTNFHSDNHCHSYTSDSSDCSSSSCDCSCD